MNQTDSYRKNPPLNIQMNLKGTIPREAQAPVETERQLRRTRKATVRSFEQSKIQKRNA